MSTAPVRNLLLGGLLLVAAWVPAATLAAPHAAPGTTRAVETPARGGVHAVRHVKHVAGVECTAMAPSQRS